MKKYFMIALGGMLGAVCRFLLQSINMSSRLDGFPINTLVINVLGSFVLSIIMGAVIKGLGLKEEVRLGICTGFLGSFTTFSTFCKESVFLLLDQKIILFFIYVFLSILSGLGAGFLGYCLGKKFESRSIVKKEGEA